MTLPPNFKKTIFIKHFQWRVVDKLTTETIELKGYETLKNVLKNSFLRGHRWINVQHIPEILEFRFNLQYATLFDFEL